MSDVQVDITETLKSYYDKLFQDGYLVCLHISRWGMGAQLEKKDIGVENVNALVRLGKKLLIEPEEISKFTSIEGKARRFLAANAYSFPIAEAHFVPKTKVPFVIQTLNTYKAQFEELVNSFIARYDELKQKVISKWPEDLQIALEGCYPRKDQLKSKFDYSLSIFEISMPKEFDDIGIDKLIEKEKAKAEAHKEALKAAQDALKEQHTKSLKQLESFTTEAAKAIRVQVVEMCKSIVGRIERKEVITKKSTDLILQEIENFRSLNFLNDKEVAEEITRLEAVVNGGHNFRTDQEAIALLDTQLKTVLTSAEDDTALDTISGEYFRSIQVK